MSLRFIIGRSGTGKTTFILDEITEKLKSNPEGPPLLYIVPEQMTFLSENKLIHSPGLAGMIRTQVYSFTRLAWRILQETGGASRTHVSSIGLNMLIRKIIEDHKDELKLFKQAADKPGFIQHVEAMFTEFKHYCVQPEELVNKQGELSFGSMTKALSDKLHDLELIYSHFEQALLGKYIDANDYLSLLANSIERSDYLKDAEIFVDGFHHFSPQEYTVLEQLIKHCRRVTVALVLDRPYKGQMPDDLHLFRMTGETYHILYNLADQNNIIVEEDIQLVETPRYKDGSLSYLETRFEKRPIQPYDADPSVELIVAANRRAEIEAVAREIRRHVMEHDYRYKDIAVVMRNGIDYQEALETVFFDYDIPYFIDQKRTMLNHPLIELIRSSLEVIQTNWRYESVFRAIKTDLLFPLDIDIDSGRERMDRLENYVLAYGIKGDQWTKKDKWKYTRFRGLELDHFVQTDEELEIENELADSRAIVTVPILRLSRRLKRAKTGRELCEAVYLFLEDLQIPEKLKALSDLAEGEGKLIASREHDQAWNAVIELLDQFVEILGEDNVSLKKFIAIMEAGFESMKFSLIPPAIDQVFVADLELSRLTDIKLAFIIGLNDGVLPGKHIEAGVFSDEDRAALLEAGLHLAPDGRQKLLNEEFVAYRAFTLAMEKTFLSYPLANDEGKALQPSPYINILKQMFPKLEEKNAENDPSELEKDLQFEYISHPNSALGYLTGQLQLKKRNYPIADFWWDVYNFYITDPTRRILASKVLSSLFYENKPKKLSEETSKALYGDNITASVSRMELFHSCPFSHFVSYGLRLQEREIYRLEAPHIGELFHAALKWIADEVTENGLSWSGLTDKQCERLAKEAVSRLAPRLQKQILLSSNRYYYIMRKLEQVICRTTQVLTGHAQNSGFSPVGIELGFGRNEKLPPFVFKLKDGTRMELQGRIDRVDKAEHNEGVYLRVIDYKSSSRDLDLTEVYYGLSLQMLTYLDIIITHSKQLIGVEATPAGVLYFHVHNPFVEGGNTIMTLEEIEKEIYKSFKMKGLVLDNPEIVRLMDTSIQESGNSQIISAGLKKDGTLNAHSKAATEDEFNILKRHVHKLYERSGNEIISGKVDIDPYRLSERTPCQFCLYRPVCQFDQALESNQFRLIQRENKNDMMNRLREEETDIENKYSG